MRSKITRHLDKVLSHLYISPLERCNLRCKICYTRKTKTILTNAAILEFVGRYQKVHPLKTITFCGGEVFTLPYFTELVNKLTLKDVILVSPDLIGAHPGPPEDSGRTSFARMTKSSGIFVQIITNGTIDRLFEFTNPNMINLIVSIDGLRSYHDKNRGKGNFDKSLKFLQKARKLGFHTEVFSIVTRQNINQIDEFEKYLNSNLNRHSGKSRRYIGTHPESISATYHPRKPLSYLAHHPLSNIKGETSGFNFLTGSEMIKIMRERKTFPPKELGCYQISLMSDAKIYACCEGPFPIGKIGDDINYLFDKLRERVEIWEKKNPHAFGCLGCSQPGFVCGIKKYLVTLSS